VTAAVAAALTLSDGLCGLPACLCLPVRAVQWDGDVVGVVVYARRGVKLIAGNGQSHEF